MPRGRRLPVRWVASRKVWEVDARPWGRIRSVLFPGAETPMKLVEREWAEEIRRTILRDVAKGVPERIAVSPYLPRESLVERWVERWMEHLEGQVGAGERSPTYLRRLRDFTRPGGQLSGLYGRTIHSIDYATLEDLAAELREQGLSPTTVLHVLSTLRTCLRWAARRSGGTYSPPEFPPVRRASTEPDVLELEDQDLILAAIADPHRGAFLAMADLMIRPGEARALNVEDYDFRTHELDVRHAMKGLTLKAPRRETKGRDRRLLTATTRLADWIETHVPKEARLNPARPLFEVRAGARYSYYTLADLWRDAARDLGIRPIGLYNGTKHSTATWLRKSGLSLEEIALALGHAGGRHTRVTELYARAPRVANSAIVRALDARTARALR